MVVVAIQRHVGRMTEYPFVDMVKISTDLQRTIEPLPNSRFRLLQVDPH